MKIHPLLTLLCGCVFLAACKPHYVDFDGSAKGATIALNRMEAQQIVREKNGEKPPEGHTTWRAYWHSRLAVLQQSPDEGSGSPGHVMRANMEFIKRTRAEAGLPPVD